VVLNHAVIRGFRMTNFSTSLRLAAGIQGIWEMVVGDGFEPSIRIMAKENIFT
jgi:hypothetical protein